MYVGIFSTFQLSGFSEEVNFHEKIVIFLNILIELASEYFLINKAYNLKKDYKITNKESKRNK